MTDLVRLSQPRSRPHARVCLADVLRRAAADVAPLCARRRLELEVGAAPEVQGFGDADDLHRAVVNLALNAIRFTPDGGCVALALHADADGDALVVRDTGVGIAASLLPRLGEPFVTGAPIDAHHSDPIAFGAGGVGLGLAVVRAIAEAHGGSLRLASVEGEGTTAAVVLPKAARESDGDGFD